MDEIVRHRMKDIIVIFNLPMTTLPRSENPKNAFPHMMGIFYSRDHLKIVVLFERTIDS